VFLTDKYPNTAALARVAQDVPGIRFETDSVSATALPERLDGFRTMFTEFHHFRPAEARAILDGTLETILSILVAMPLLNFHMMSPCVRAGA
jgi:hypothetical protein